MEHLGLLNLLNKFKNSVKNNQDLKEYVLGVIKSETKILLSTKSIVYKDKKIILKVRPAQKNAIFLVKEKLLKILKRKKF